MKQFVPNMTLKKKKTHVVPHGDTFEEIESVHAMVSQPGGFYTFAKHIQVSTTFAKHIQVSTTRPPWLCGGKLWSDCKLAKNPKMQRDKIVAGVENSEFVPGAWYNVLL